MFVSSERLFGNKKLSRYRKRWTLRERPDSSKTTHTSAKELAKLINSFQMTWQTDHHIHRATHTIHTQFMHGITLFLTRLTHTPEPELHQQIMHDLLLWASFALSSRLCNVRREAGVFTSSPSCKDMGYYKQDPDLLFKTQLSASVHLAQTHLPNMSETVLGATS